MERSEASIKIKSIADDFMRKFGTDHPPVLYLIDESDHLHMHHVSMLHLNSKEQRAHLTEAVNKLIQRHGATVAALALGVYSAKLGDSGEEQELMSQVEAGLLQVSDIGDESLMLWVQDAEGGDLHIGRASEEDIWGERETEWESHHDLSGEDLGGRVGVELSFRFPKSGP